MTTRWGHVGDITTAMLNAYAEAAGDTTTDQECRAVAMAVFRELFLEACKPLYVRARYADALTVIADLGDQMRQGLEDLTAQEIADEDEQEWDE